MKRVYKYIALCLSLTFLLLLCSCKKSDGQNIINPAITNPHESDVTFSAAILQYDNGSDANEIRQSFIARMRTLGYDEAKMKFDIKNASGKGDTLNLLAAEIKDKKYDLTVAIGEKAAIAIKSSDSKTPCVFINVEDPVSSGLVGSLTEPDGTMTGVTSKMSFDALIPVMQISTPNVVNIGIIYTKGNDISKKAAELAEKSFTENTFGVELLEVGKTQDLTANMSGLLERVDALYLIGGDSLTTENIDYILDAADLNSKLVFSSNQAFVAKGALLSVCAGNEDMAKSGALLADKILQGEKISNIPVTTDVELSIYINRVIADKYSVEPPINIQNLVYL